MDAALTPSINAAKDRQMTKKSNKSGIPGGCRDADEGPIPSTFIALEWNYRTDRAARECRKAFTPWRGDRTTLNALIGFTQPCRIDKDGMHPVSSYDILQSGKHWIGGTGLEDFDEDVLTAVGKAVLTSSYGNRDSMLLTSIERLMLQSRHEAIIRVSGRPENNILGRWPWGSSIDRIVMADMLIFTPRDASTHVSVMKDQFARQGIHNPHVLPALSIAILPPGGSQHDRLARHAGLADIANFLQRHHDTPSIAFKSPDAIIIP